MRVNDLAKVRKYKKLPIVCSHSRDFACLDKRNQIFTRDWSLATFYAIQMERLDFHPQFCITVVLARFFNRKTGIQKDIPRWKTLSVRTACVPSWTQVRPVILRRHRTCSVFSSTSHEYSAPLTTSTPPWCPDSAIRHVWAASSRPPSFSHLRLRSLASCMPRTR